MEDMNKHMMNKKIYISVLLWCLFSLQLFAFQFEKNDKIVFIGNSITHGGSFHNVLRTFLATRYQKDLTIFNKGISGDVAQGVLDRLEEDILSEKPTVAFVMLGMNDVQRWAYVKNPSKGQIKAQENAIVVYKEKAALVIKKLQEHNIRIILLTPTIFDENPLIKRNNNIGVNEALGKCATYIKSLGKKHQLRVVDFYTILNQINKEQQEINPNFTIIGKDRVHPGKTGHFVMGYQLIETLEKENRMVSNISIHVKKKKTLQAINCSITKIEGNSKHLKFSVLANSLPVPLSQFDKNGQQLVPFSDNLNQEFLSFKKLRKGNYKLSIDGVFIGSFNEKSLENGIRLDTITKTPQYQQALKVKQVSDQIRWHQNKIRDLRYVDYMQLKIKVPSLAKEEKIKLAKEKYTEFENSKSQYLGYYKKMLKNYINNLGKETTVKQQIVKLRQELFKLSKPVERLYELVIIDNDK